MKKILLLILAAFAATILMSTKCSSFYYHSAYWFNVENKSNVQLDSLSIGSYYLMNGKDSLVVSKYRIGTESSKKNGYLAYYEYSSNDKFYFELLDSNNEVVADTMLILPMMPEQADGVKITFVLSADLKLSVDSVSIPKVE